MRLSKIGLPSLLARGRAERALASYEGVLTEDAAAARRRDGPKTRFTEWIVSEAPWQWLVSWLILPNLIIILMWSIGGPPMTYALQLFGYTALVAAQLPWVWLKRLILSMMIGAIMAIYVCLMFNLPVWGIVYWPAFAREMHLWQAPVYAAAAVVFAAVLVLTLKLAPRTPRFRSSAQWLMGFAAVFGLSAADTLATARTGESYHSQWLPEQPFSSAAEVTGLSKPASARRNVVIVLVEALGVPTGKVERELFAADWGAASWGRGYTVKLGRIPYYGSTTNAEFRALCNRWGNYDSFDYRAADCLPERYKRAGYRTTAIHSFTGSFFDRKNWYPRLGFDSILFSPDLVHEGARACGGIFPGACDDDVPAIIARQLRKGAKPQLVYWLTLNSHLPVIADGNLGTANCNLGPRDWVEENPQLCRLFLVHHRLAKAIKAVAEDPGLPPTDFLIVGDHMPPFFDRDRRSRFDGRNVPYVLLRSRR